MKVKRVWIHFAVWTVLATSMGVAGAMTRVVVADFSSGTTGKGTPVGWQLNEKSGRADFQVVSSEGVPALNLRSRQTSFSFQKQIDIDTRQYPMLTWRWKVTALPARGDFRNSSRDDQAAQLFVAFSRTKAIVYIWDSTAPEGTVGEAAAPPFVDIKAIVVRSGPDKTGRWITEKRNIFRDFLLVFGQEPPHVRGIRIQINSQHTRSSAESYFADVSFRNS